MSFIFVMAVVLSSCFLSRYYSKKTAYETLDGLSQSTAMQQAENFKTYAAKDMHYKSVYRWYSKQQIKEMDKLLTSEATSKQVDGIRVYLGCDNPGVVVNPKLNNMIFLVPTKLQNIDGHSRHGDYYDHPMSYPVTTGENTVDDNADASESHGATLYSLPALPPESCSNPGDHYINVAQCQQWVAKRRENGGSAAATPINTYSEWYPYCFIKSLFDAILDGKNNLDGLRIYLGKGDLSVGLESYKDKDLFILVPTYPKGSDHFDYYQCLEELEPKFCRKSNGTNAITMQPNFRWMMGGYDNGEMCPNSCN